MSKKVWLVAYKAYLRYKGLDLKCVKMIFQK